MNKIRIFIRRNLINNKMTYLNIAGLVLGMFTFLFIYFYVYAENNYDQFVPNANNLYHIEWEVQKNGTNSLYSTTPIPLAETVYKEVAGIKDWATYCYVFETDVLNNGESDFLDPDVFYANPGFLSMFNYKAVFGNLKNAIEPGKVVITRSAAKKYLGTENAVGKQIKLLHDKKTPLIETVAAVIEDIPQNSNVQFEVVGSLDDYLNLVGQWVGNWYIKPSQSYISLEEGVTIAQVENELDNVLDKYVNSKNDVSQGQVAVTLEKISEKHFRKNYTFQMPNETFVSKFSLQIIFAVGVITLLISWLNFINFLNFQLSKRLKEAGLRKIIGSSRWQMAVNLLKESLLITAIPMAITLVLFFWLSPAVYKLFQISIEKVVIDYFIFWPMVIGILLIGSIFSAFQPILKLTAFQPLELLEKKRKLLSSSQKGSFIIMAQFIFTIVLICSILAINKQMDFIQKQELGFTAEHILTLSPPMTSSFESYVQNMGRFKEEASRLPGIVGISASSSVPGKKLTTEHFGLKNREETINKYLGLSCDEDYFNVIDAKFIAGRNFSPIPDIQKNEIIINRVLAQELGFTNPADALNQLTNWGEKRIIGVVENYHHTSLRDNVQPMLFKIGLDRLSNLMIKSEKQLDATQLDYLKHHWNTDFENSPFEYTLLDNIYKNQYNGEQKLSRIVLIFSIFSIIISVLGLIGQH